MDFLAQQRIKAMSDEELYRAALLGMLRNRLQYYKPYPKQFAFHREGLLKRQRLLMAGNQEGKTYSGAAEMAIHLTGRYPDWWPGRVYTSPVLAWTGSESNETSRELIQANLLGCEVLDKSHPEFGTGAIPAECILGVGGRQAGVKDVADQILVRHASGGISRVLLKVYEQGWQKFQGKKVDIVWLDEEPPHFKIYSECLTRIQAAEKGMLYLTFTPLQGMSDVVAQFMDSEREDDAEGNHDDMAIINMTIYDCIGGTWPEGTPFAGKQWKGHYTKEKADRIVAGYPKHERRTRALGIPMMGEGMVWPFDQDDFVIDPIPIPKHFPQIGGVDFGIDHPFGFVTLAWDRDADVVYLTHCYKMSGQTPGAHCDVIKRIAGDWMPIAWPHDGDQREKSTGAKLVAQYRGRLPNFLAYSARYDKDKGGPQPVEPIVLEVSERIQQGRFKVFSTCGDWLEEQRMFHRKEGRIVPAKDDCIKASLYALMELRHARCKPEPQPIRTTRPILTQWGATA